VSKAARRWPILERNGAFPASNIQQRSNSQEMVSFMPVFDTPITTDAGSLKKVLAQNLPVVLYLYDSRQGNSKPVEDAFTKIAKKHAGELLVARVDVAANPDVHREYGSLPTPAVLTLAKSLFSRKLKSQAGSIRPADIRAHVDYLLDRGPQPAAPEPPPAPAKTAAGGERPAAQHVTDSNFRQVVLNSKVPVLVDFWAPWCAPCRMIAPVIEQMAKEYAGRVKVVKLNVDENPKTAGQFEVRSIPTLILFRDGRALERQVGANPRVIRDMIEESLLPSR
jgi:thioredoxin 1